MSRGRITIRMAYSVIIAATKSRPECKDSDRIPRLLVESPTTNFSIARDADAIIEVTATLSFSSRLLVLFFLNRKKADFIVVASGFPFNLGPLL